MENKSINLAIVTKVATALQELNEQMAYVGGAVISLYTDDPAADEVRPTKDIDMVIDLAGFGAWARMQERLAVLKFHPDPNETVICRYKFEDVQVDIMPKEDSSLGNSNPWYKPGFDHLQEVVIDDDTSIKLLPACYFIATKFAAFHGRGTDYRTSHDFEDIIYVIDNRSTIVDEILAADEPLVAYLKEQFNLVISQPNLEEIITAQLSPLIAEGRYPIILDKIKSIII